MAYTTINDPSEYFNTVLYSGTGSTRSITGLGFSPDWTWIKERNNAVSHRLFDSVRGATKRMFSNNTDAESTATNSLTSFDSDGFSLGDSGSVNGGSDTYVAWNWRASDSNAVSNSDGSITSTVSANTTAGFSIMTYTGNGSDNSTIGHGLGKAPSMIIIKGRSSVEDWMVYHKNLTAGSEIILNSSAGQVDDTNNATWGDNHPSSVGSSTFAVGYAGDSNANGTTYVAYCFAEIEGYSKIGSYTGNGNADGTFVYTGFRPAWILRKYADGGEQWHVQDTKRLDVNNDSDSSILIPSTNGAEATNTNLNMDILSNGFKCRSSDGAGNGSGRKYIYMAFAEHPFVSSKGVPVTAR